MTMNGAVLPILAGYVVAAEEQGVAQDQLSGTIQNDILKEFMVRNTYIYPPKPSMKIIGDIIEYTARTCRSSTRSRFRATTCRKPGPTRRWSWPSRWPMARNTSKPRLPRAWTWTTFAGRLSFFWAVGMNFYLEIAKMRAARLLWCRIMQGFNAKKPKSLMLRTHCQTSGWSLTEQDPYNNVVRTTIEAMAAVVRRHPVAAHQCAGRSHCAADRVLGPHRAQHAAHHPGRNPHHQRDRPLGRLLHDGKADPGHGGQGLGHHRGSRGHGRHDPGGGQRLGQAARSKRPPPRSRRASTPARKSSSA